MVYCVFNELGKTTDPKPPVVHVVEKPGVTVPERSIKLKFAQILSLEVIATSGAETKTTSIKSCSARQLPLLVEVSVSVIFPSKVSAELMLYVEIGFEAVGE